MRQCNGFQLVLSHYMTHKPDLPTNSHFQERIMNRMRRIIATLVYTAVLSRNRVDPVANDLFTLRS